MGAGSGVPGGAPDPNLSLPGPSSSFRIRGSFAARDAMYQARRSSTHAPCQRKYTSKNRCHKHTQYHQNYRFRQSPCEAKSSIDNNILIINYYGP